MSGLPISLFTYWHVQRRCNERNLINFLAKMVAECSTLILATGFYSQPCMYLVPVTSIHFDRHRALLAVGQYLHSTQSQFTYLCFQMSRIISHSINTARQCNVKSCILNQVLETYKRYICTNLTFVKGSLACDRVDLNCLWT